MWSLESVGRNLHCPAPASRPLRHNDVKDSPMSYIHLDNDKASKTSCPALGTNFIVGGRRRVAHVSPVAKPKPHARLVVTLIVDNSYCA